MFRKVADSFLVQSLGSDVSFLFPPSQVHTLTPSHPHKCTPHFISQLLFKHTYEYPHTCTQTCRLHWQHFGTVRSRLTTESMATSSLCCSTLKDQTLWTLSWTSCKVSPQHIQTYILFVTLSLMGIIFYIWYIRWSLAH